MIQSAAGGYFAPCRHACCRCLQIVLALLITGSVPEMVDINRYTDKCMLNAYKHQVCLPPSLSLSRASLLGCSAILRQGRLAVRIPTFGRSLHLRPQTSHQACLLACHAEPSLEYAPLPPFAHTSGSTPASASRLGQDLEPPAIVLPGSSDCGSTRILPLKMRR